MAKAGYRIPAPLNRSFLDHEIVLSGGGWSIRPAPIKQLLVVAGGVLLTLWSATSSFISDAGPLWIALWVIWSLSTVVYLGGMTRTKELRLMTVPALLAYLPPSSRRVLTRRNSRPGDLYTIIGINRIDPAGRIHYTDGAQGQAYLVVGTASYLLFEADRQAILDRVDAFWRKLETSCEWITVTTKEPQRVHHQLAAAEQRKRALTARDPDLAALQREQYAILGQQAGRASIHQYLVLRGTSADALRRAEQLLHAEVEGSALMLKEATALGREETLAMLASLYQGVDHARSPHSDTLHCPEDR